MNADASLPARHLSMHAYLDHAERVHVFQDGPGHLHFFSIVFWFLSGRGCVSIMSTNHARCLTFCHGLPIALLRGDTELGRPRSR